MLHLCRNTIYTTLTKTSQKSLINVLSEFEFISLGKEDHSFLTGCVVGRSREHDISKSGGSRTEHEIGSERYGDTQEAQAQAESEDHIA